MTKGNEDSTTPTAKMLNSHQISGCRPQMNLPPIRAFRCSNHVEGDMVESG